MGNELHELRNHIGKADALERLNHEPFRRVVFSFYRYVILDDPTAWRNKLFVEWSELGAFGRIYLASEGINAQMSVPEPNFEAFRAALYAHAEFEEVPLKIGVEQKDTAFWKLTIKVRKQIVADGLKSEEYDVTDVGTHLGARQWNELSQKPETTVVDMRNNYESAIGRFEGALCPDVFAFREGLPVVLETLKGKEDTEVLLYCTGGIRCEKASAYLRHNGFKKVYQLHGGIIDYKHEVDREGLPSRFKGVNFVFDNRLGERITDDVLGVCYQCEGACDSYVNCRNEQCNLLFIQCASCQEKFSGCCSVECAGVASLPEAERVVLRKGRKVPKNTNVFRTRIAIKRG